jgi:signal transduction histidine kinase
LIDPHLANARQATCERLAGERMLTMVCHLAPEAPLKIAVADTGAGIAPAIRSRIFDPYFNAQAHGCRHGCRPVRSLGMCRRSAARSASSVREGGARFRVRLPVAIRSLPLT